MMRNLFWFTVFVLLLSGCSSQNKSIEVIHTSETTEEMENVKQILEKSEHVEKGAVVFVKNHLLIGVEINPLSRWNKKKIEGNLQKEVEEAFPTYEVLLSTDRKILWETKNLLKNRSNEEDIEQKIKKIKELEKEET